MSELNLIPPYLKEKNYRKIKTRNNILIGLIGISIISFLIYFPASELYRTKVEETAYKKKAEETNNALITIENEGLNKEIEYYEQYIEKVEQLSQNKIKISNRIRELEKYIPSDVIFDSMSYGENTLTINATANSIDSIRKFVSNIQTANTYKKVRVRNIITEDKTSNDNEAQKRIVYRFTINAVE